MYRRLSTLYGLAILAVVISHTTGWGITAMFWWAHRYRPVTSPNFDQFGTLPYYILIILQQLSFFSVPAFIFGSGFFVAYASRGSSTQVSWKTIRSRLSYLLIPYLIWSVLIFSIDYLQGIKFQPIEYIYKLIFGQAVPPYYFIPVLCQLFLLSPFILPIVKKSPKFALIISGLFQLIVLILHYNTLLKFLSIGAYLVSFPEWFFGNWIFFFTLGSVAGTYITEFKLWITKLKWFSLFILFVFGCLQILESEFLYRLTGIDARGPEAITSSIYAFSFILVFFAFENIKIPFSRHLVQLGKYSYGIYLIHYSVLFFTARLIYHFAPIILGKVLIFQIFLIAVGLAFPLIMMILVEKSRGRKYYRYLFG